MEDYRKLKGKDSIKKLQEWRDLLLQKTSLSDGRPIPTVLLLNKSDMPHDSTIEVVTEESQKQSEEKMDTGGAGDSGKKSDQDDASRVSGNTAEITRHIEEEQKGDSISESQSENDFYGEILDCLKVNGIYKTSAKDGKNVKVAIACLVREILKEGSFINRVDSQGSYIGEASPNKKQKIGKSHASGSSQSDL